MMRSHPVTSALLILVLAAVLPAQGLFPDVQERKLDNGLRILLVERPGTGAVHAQLFLRDGLADTGALPAVAAELMARCLFASPVDGEASEMQALESLLKREEGAFESLRLECIRQERRSGGEVAVELPELRMLQQQLLSQIEQRTHNRTRRDPLDELGATRRGLEVEADWIAFRSDLPKEGFESYARYMAERLKQSLLARFPIERDRVLRSIGRTIETRERQALDVFLGTALSGHPYAQVYDLRRSGVEALTWSDTRSHARWAASPERIVLVLVGDVRMSEVFPVLERHFGSLRNTQAPLGLRGEQPVDAAESIGPRRLQVGLPGGRRLFMGWHVPSMTHPDHLALEVIAQILGGGATSRLSRRLEGEHDLARFLSVGLNMPGGRDSSLLMIEAQPVDRRGLAELEQAVQGELTRLQRGSFLEGEISRAQRQVEADQLMVQEDAGTLARALGAAMCEGGDWRLGFRAFQLKRDFTQPEIQAIVLKYLIPSQSIGALLEPDPIHTPQDRLEGQTAEVLTRILESKLDDPGQVDALVREALRQLRMLPLKEREQTLRLLEAQVKP